MTVLRLKEHVKITNGPARRPFPRSLRPVTTKGLTKSSVVIFRTSPGNEAYPAESMTEELVLTG